MIRLRLEITQPINELDIFPTLFASFLLWAFEFLNLYQYQISSTRMKIEISHRIHRISRCNRSCTWTIWNISTAWFGGSKLSRKLDQYWAKNWLCTSLTLSETGLFIYLSLEFKSHKWHYLKTCKIPPTVTTYICSKNLNFEKMYQIL